MHDLNKDVDEVDCDIDRTEENTGAPSDIAEPVSATVTEARVLTIPGAVYRIPATPAACEAGEASPAVEPHVTLLPGPPEEPVQIYAEAVADAAADDNSTYTQSAPSELQSAISYPAVSEVAEVDIAAGEAACGAAPLINDAGVYAAPFEHNEHEPVSDETHPVGIPYDPSHEEERYTGVLEEQEQKSCGVREKVRASADEDAGHLYLPVDSIDRSVKLVEARMLYEIETMKAEHRMLGYTFSTDVLKKDRTERKMRRQISNRIYKLSRALKRERADSTRYYTAVLDRYQGSADKRAKNAALIESILDRLDYALKEREQIDQSLMRLYVQDDDKTASTKEAKVAKRAAKAVYRSQLKVAKRVARMHAPEELKEKIFTLMNERTTMIATIEKNEYLLRKKRYTGADKRDVKRQIREMKRAVRHKEEDIRFFIKKAEKHDTAHSDGIRQLGWLIVTLIIAGAVGGLYLLGKYYWGWF